MLAAIFALARPPTAPTAAGLTAVALSVFLVTLIQVPEASIAQVQVAQQRAAKAGQGSSMRRCMATWDRSAQMSKQDWKETCKRVIKENPGLYGKPF
jgi:hypothetical protein